MLFHADNEGGQWAATVAPNGNVRLLRQTTKPPYREGGDPSLEYQTVEIDPHIAQALGQSLIAAGEVGTPLLISYREAVEGLG